MTKRKFRYNWRTGEWDGINQPYIVARPHWETAPEQRTPVPLSALIIGAACGFWGAFVVWWLL